MLGWEEIGGVHVVEGFVGDRVVLELDAVEDGEPVESEGDVVTRV